MDRCVSVSSGTPNTCRSVQSSDGCSSDLRVRAANFALQDGLVSVLHGSAQTAAVPPRESRIDAAAQRFQLESAIMTYRPKDLTAAELDQLHALDNALRFARSQLSPDITAQRLLILICVYFNQGLSQRELLTKLESTSITALSRNLADLSVWTTRKNEGPGLIELRADPMNLRVKRVFLTTAGEKFVRRWLAAGAKAHTASRRTRKQTAPER